MTFDAISTRMKRYEHAFRSVLPQRLPIILRVDGKAFHTLLRHAERPFDGGVIACMNRAALALCEELQGAQIAYVQSDEISVFIHPYRRLQSQPVFDGEVQKLASISAAIAASTFSSGWSSLTNARQVAVFDGRVFVLPESDVCNYFVWRQQDATRNSIQMVARVHFSHAQCDNKNTSQLQEMLWQERKINWNDCETHHKRGRCVVRETYSVAETERHRWVIDDEPPIFTQDRSYIEQWLACGPETEAVPA